ISIVRRAPSTSLLPRSFPLRSVPKRRNTNSPSTPMHAISEGADTVRHSFAIVLSLWVTTLQAWAEPRVNAAQKHSQPADVLPIVRKPARVWDWLSNVAETGWIVVVRGKTIEAAGPADRVKVPGEAHSVEIPNSTLIPGLIDLHTHILLHPYNEALW